MTTLELLRARVRTRFEAESTTRWSDDKIDGAINAGLKDLSEETGFYERYFSVPFLPNNVYYDLRGYTPEEVVAVTAVWSNPNQIWLDYCPPERMPIIEWERSEGDPKKWMIHGLWWLGIFPRPSAGTDYMRVYYSGIHPPLVQDDDPVYDLPTDYEVAVEDYALYELQGKDGETTKALLHYASYSESAKSLKQTVQGRNQLARENKMGYN